MEDVLFGILAMVVSVVILLFPVALFFIIIRRSGKIKNNKPDTVVSSDPFSPAFLELKPIKYSHQDELLHPVRSLGNENPIHRKRNTGLTFRAVFLAVLLLASLTYMAQENSTVQDNSDLYVETITWPKLEMFRPETRHVHVGYGCCFGASFGHGNCYYGPIVRAPNDPIDCEYYDGLLWH